MITARTIEETRAAIREPRSAGRTIGFVPTMGFLHHGHLSLIHVAREHGAEFIAACHSERSEESVWECGTKPLIRASRPHRSLATLGMTS